MGRIGWWRVGGALALAVGMSVLLSGCRAAPEPPAGFVKPEALLAPSPEDTAFRREWVSPEVDLKQFRKIYVAPVRTDFRKKGSFLHDSDASTDFLGHGGAEMQDFKRYVYDSLRRAVARSGRFQLAAEPGPGVLTLEMALVRVVPGKPLYHVLLVFCPPFPLNIVVNFIVNEVTDKAFTSQLAMECKIVDGNTGRLIAGFAGNEKQQMAILNLLNFTAMGNQRQMADFWAAALVEKLKVGRGFYVVGPEPFVLINY